jgi:hypothetical protein
MGMWRYKAPKARCGCKTFCFVRKPSWSTISESPTWCGNERAVPYFTSITDCTVDFALEPPITITRYRKQEEANIRYFFFINAYCRF